MPITTSAKQALRKDRTRTVQNIRRKRRTKQAMDQYKAKPTQKALQTAVSQIDKMVKWNLWHQNKAARLKSQLGKLLVLNKETSSKSKTTSKN